MLLTVSSIFDFFFLFLMVILGYYDGMTELHEYGWSPTPYSLDVVVSGDARLLSYYFIVAHR